MAAERLCMRVNESGRDYALLFMKLRKGRTGGIFMSKNNYSTSGNTSDPCITLSNYKEHTA